MSNRIQAYVKWFSNEKGFGFLDGPDGDVFVHYRSIEPGEEGYKSLNAGELVEYTPITTDRGRAAAEVTIVYETSDEEPDLV